LILRSRLRCRHRATDNRHAHRHCECRHTYQRFAEAVNRLDMNKTVPKQFPDLIGGVTERAAKRKTAGAIDAVAERVEEVFSRDEQADRND
jgi:hypothetical protein